MAYSSIGADCQDASPAGQPGLPTARAGHLVRMPHYILTTSNTTYNIQILQYYKYYWPPCKNAPLHTHHFKYKYNIQILQVQILLATL